MPLQWQVRSILPFATGVGGGRLVEGGEWPMRLEPVLGTKCKVGKAGKVARRGWEGWGSEARLDSDRADWVVRE